ncbi:D-sedoheptulose 7-phosphate isomerase [Carboxylicivirga sp. M1479]|uniref:D-sedoheptulose 7-phosphate isomerase n=1 Tax=Carboxylicivirga sp. M1479 TaxID=2594476 RepID=UPI0011773EFE|nr:D-sedoheptulose 7-phosphate isomerase [Carboxylicivirga sp. M1479]TRX72228.1 D-sedoheptulose 7-phosphate isomerase [Carboxylicivirga sp. M1479]
MTRDDIITEFKEAQAVLERFMAEDSNWEKMLAAGDLMVSALHKSAKIISCGNGGSMSDAMHFAEELTGRFRDNRPGLAAIAIADPTHITCVGNDYGFDYIFSRYVEAVGQSNDVLLAISTSGNSTNVLNAARAAKEKGMTVIALTGKSGGELAEVADIELRAPHQGYSDRIQEIHIKIIHVLIQYIESKVV